MGTTIACLLAIVIVLVVLIVAVLATRANKKRAAKQKSAAQSREGFMPGDAATPKLRVSVGQIGGTLARITHLADSIEKNGDVIKEAAPSTGGALDEANQSLAQTQSGMSEIVYSVRRLQTTLETMTPTYQNVLGLYRGLRDSDKYLLEAAKSLGAAGDKTADEVSLAGDQAETAQGLKDRLAESATELKDMSRQIRILVRQIHVLGADLQLE